MIDLVLWLIAVLPLATIVLGWAVLRAPVRTDPIMVGPEVLRAMVARRERPDVVMTDLRESIAADVLRDAEDLRAAGGDPQEIVARLRPQVDELLRRRRERWQEQARSRLADRRTR